jgi:hypothetical protein
VLNHVGLNAIQRHRRAEMVLPSLVNRSEGGLAAMKRSASRLFGRQWVEDFLGGALCLLLWAALWSLFIAAYPT